MDANSSICLSRIANGELEEKFQHELARVLQNLMAVSYTHLTLPTNRIV